MLHERPYLRGRNPGQLQRSVTFHKAISPQLSESPAISPAVSKRSSTDSRDLKKNSIVLPKRPYLRRNPGILPRGIPFHKSKGFKEKHSKDDVDHLIGDVTSKPYFEILKKHAIMFQSPYLIRDRNNHGQSPQGVTFHKAISPAPSISHVVSLAVSPISRNTNSIIPKRPYLRGNPRILPEGVTTYPKAISPRVSKANVINSIKHSTWV
ncbi:hypothetical protein FXO37_30936 [Capsicum annuum]|nr:hypothetical protein FXO37_30936 [Capsicum annuum]